MNWHAHTKKISNRIWRPLGVMNRLKPFLPLKILRTIYNAQILRHMQYSIHTWGLDMTCLVKLKKRAIRIINRIKCNTHTEPLFKQLYLLKINDRFTLNIVKLCWRFKHGTLPQYFLDMFQEGPVRHQSLWRGKMHVVSSTKNHKYFGRPHH